MTKQYSMDNVKALSFDLDDTLYDNGPVIKNAFLALYKFLLEQFPEIQNNYDFDAFITAAKAIKKSQPLNADLGSLRRQHINQVIKNSGYSKELSSDYTEQAFHVFWQARQQVTLYPNVIKLLEVLATKLPLVTISNGNACTKSIGISQFFQFSINAMETGKPKPDSSMFHLACEKLSIEPNQLVHIGDSLTLDVSAATLAGCRSVWFNPTSLKAENHKAEVVIEQLSELLSINFNA